MASPDELFARLLDGPWAISERDFLSLRNQLAAVFAARPDGFFELADLVTPRAGLAFDEDRGVATISVQGALADKAPAVWEKLGQTDYRTIRAELDQARAVGASMINLSIDSPGGSLAGLEETSRAIAECSAAGIPVTAHADGMACSAAYWLASSADRITATPSADVGNIGVVMAWADSTKFWESQGVEFHTLTNEGADLKGTFRESPTDSQLEFLQDRIDEHGADFRDHVTNSRDVDPEVFRAGWYSGPTALSLGLVDKITNN